MSELDTPIPETTPKAKKPALAVVSKDLLVRLHQFLLAVPAPYRDTVKLIAEVEHALAQNVSITQQPPKPQTEKPV